MKLFKTILIISTLSLFSCSAELSSESKKIELNQLEQQWILIAVNGKSLSSKIESTLTIDSTAKATGNLACNQFFGTLELQKKQLRIAKMGTTRKMCQDKINAVEMIVSSILSNWSKIQLSNNLLILNGKKDKLSYRIKE